MTHDVKNCCERPRKVGARFTGRDFKPDEVLLASDLALDYAGKRDRWNGYDSSEHTALMSKYEAIDKERRVLKREKDAEAVKAEGEDAAAVKNESDKEEGDEEGFKEGTGYNNAPIQKMDPKTRTTVRNLRIREDTAKYLYNLDPDSAYYDPKTRSMRENPNPTEKPQEQLYAGDNFARAGGDVSKFADMQLYSWDAYDRGQEVHPQAAPSQAELLHREFKVKKDQLKEQQKRLLSARYGGDEVSAEAPPRALLLAQTEEYVEYSRSGQVIKGGERQTARSRWEEDVLINNHTAVWGSWWQDSQWGYSCCHLLIKNSYCTGEAGRKLAAGPLAMATATSEKKEVQQEEEEEEEPPKSLMEERLQQLKTKGKGKEEEEERKKEQQQQDRLALALADEDRRARASTEEELTALDAGSTAGRKRKYNSLSADSVDVTDEQMEAYHLKRVHMEDPMRDFIGKE
eukprot:TRINITY_DN5137_c1_g1_i3.p1 TRINITY_DN5137_c1_g1~~TRINITY_DN5137_c1_g1_i3.p1  ORF type:complete len:459 (-),score=171.77 TRINITY_DN5137_c1_g1_i3:59-1435(-)